MKPHLSILLLPFLAQTAFAAEALTYEEVLQATLEGNPALLASQYAFEQSQADLRSAKGDFDPNLSVDGNWSQSESLDFVPPFPDPFTSQTESWNVGMTFSGRAPTGTGYTLRGNVSQFNVRFEDFDGVTEQPRYQPNFNLQLTQEVLRGIWTKFNNRAVEQAKENLTRAEIALQQERQTQLAAVAQAYWNWVYLTEVADISDQSIAIAEENLRIGQERFEATLGTKLELTRLELALTESKTAAIDAHNNAAQALDQVLVQMGQRPGAEYEPGSDPGVIPEFNYTVEQAIDTALEQSLQIQLARIDRDIAQLNFQTAKHATLPTLTLSGNAGLFGGSGVGWDEAFNLLGRFPRYGFGATFAAPLGNRAARGNKERAAASLHTAEVRLTEAERNVTAQVAQQVRILSSAFQKVELADLNVRLAQETLEAEQATYDAGRRVIKDVLEAQLDLDRKRSEAAKARTDYRVARVELLQLLGLLEREMSGLPQR